jgi:hypothetical protein
MITREQRDAAFENDYCIALLEALSGIVQPRSDLHELALMVNDLVTDETMEQ